MLDVIFYFQLVLVLAILAYAFFSRHWAFFGMAGVFVILTGAMLVAGEPIEYATGTFSVIESYGNDSNITRIIPDYNAFTVDNSQPVWMWGNLMMYGGWLFIIIAFVLVLDDVREWFSGGEPENELA